MSQLNKKTILITGAAGGIGRATAILLAQEGAQVAVNDLFLEKAEEVAIEIRRNNGEAIAIQADIIQKDEVEKMIGQIKEKFGPVDILINNATAPIDFKHFKDLDWQEFQKHLEVQIRGAYNTIKSVLPDMMERKSGNIVNIITEAVQEVPPVYFSGYITAKYGLLGMTRSLMVELKNYGISVNAVFPKLTNTALTKELPRFFKEIAAKEYPSGKISEPEDIAEEILSIIKC